MGLSPGTAVSLPPGGDGRAVVVLPVGAACGRDVPCSQRVIPFR